MDEVMEIERSSAPDFFWYCNGTPDIHALHIIS